MAAITGFSIQLLYSDGVCSRMAVFSLKKVSAGDTADLGNWFSVVKRCGLMSATSTDVLACTITGNTIVTVPAGPTNDGVWIFAWGVSA